MEEIRIGLKEGEHKTGSDAVVAIAISTIFFWILATVLTVDRAEITLISYEQLAGVLLGMVVGLLISVYIMRATFMDKLRHETFSFVGLSLALLMFAYNITLPRRIATTMTHLFASKDIPSTITHLMSGDTTGGTNPLFLSLIIGFILVVVIGVCIMKITGMEVTVS